MNQESGIGQSIAMLFFRRQIDVGSDAADPTRADYAHHGLDELNHVVNGVTGLHMATGRANVQSNGVVGFKGQRQQLLRRLTSNVLIYLAEKRQGTIFVQYALQHVCLLRVLCFFF